MNKDIIKAVINVFINIMGVSERGLINFMHFLPHLSQSRISFEHQNVIISHSIFVPFLSKQHFCLIIILSKLNISTSVSMTMSIRFVREDSAAISYSCLSSCVYERDDQPGTAFCFAQGDQQVIFVCLLHLSACLIIHWIISHFLPHGMLRYLLCRWCVATQPRVSIVTQNLPHPPLSKMAQAEETPLNKRGFLSGIHFVFFMSHLLSLPSVSLSLSLSLLSRPSKCLGAESSKSSKSKCLEAEWPQWCSLFLRPSCIWLPRPLVAMYHPMLNKMTCSLFF